MLPPGPVTKSPTQFEAEAALAFLESVVGDRTRLTDVDESTRRRLMQMAGEFLYPDSKTKRSLAKAFRKRDKRIVKETDERVLETTGIRVARANPVFVTPPRYELPENIEGTERSESSRSSEQELLEERKCYVCKTRFRTVHWFYDQMCAACGDFNHQKRTQSADLRDRTVLVTGARLKIGYQASILLLRAGARVIVTTRFPHDAALRFSREPDYASFVSRLVIHGLDLRHTPSVETFCKHLIDTESRLDHIIHNACQTVRRPAGFYSHLMDEERKPLAALPSEVRSTLASHDGLRAGSLVVRDETTDAVGLTRAAELSQWELLDEDALRGGAIFPVGSLDADLQQVDRRRENSWRLTLADVPTIELLEVQLVNAVAPFVMNSKLKPLMLRTENRDKHIVNVSAMEGQFYRTYKTDRHPHTNMAKAALNMMTRTSAPDYAKDGIHMNSVDTGWVTDEDPAHLAERKKTELGFHPPLDIVDGAARIVDPIFDGANTGNHLFGLFLKDYRPIPW